MTLGECTRIVAPYYNLVLVLIAVFLFWKLFSAKQKKSFLLPWKLLFAAVLIYIVEQVLTVIKFAGLISYPIIINLFFEMAIITLFIYMLLLQKEYLARQKRGKHRK